MASEPPFQSYFNKQVDAFYDHLYTSQCIYLNETPTKEDGTEYRNFWEYWCYVLYRDYGIKRKIHKYGEGNELQSDLEKRIYGDNNKLLLQFYYNKSSSNYNNANMITQLCRHMLFDIATYSIVSLGVCKTLQVDGIWEHLPSSPAGQYSLAVEKFYEGTMLVYNPSLSVFNYEIINKTHDEENDNSERQIRHFETSTRRKIGTSYFNNPGMTFQQMFEANNKEAGLDWTKMDNDFQNQFCFVFNVEHEENRIINPTIQNRNTLVAVYHIKPRNINQGIIANLMANRDMLLDKTIFMQLRQDCISETAPYLINQMVNKMFGQTINGPELITMVSGTKDDILASVNNIVSKQGKYDIGVIVKDVYSGARFKVRNSKYSELLAIKGHLPMSLNERNNANLFRLWWRLKNDKQIQKFLGLFETNDKQYEKLFRSYHEKLVSMTQTLFNVYQSVFVRKEDPALSIEYKFKPMCGDLHTAYKEEQRGRTKGDVVKYVNSRAWYQIYWRLFGLPENTTDTLSEQPDINLPDNE